MSKEIEIGRQKPISVTRQEHKVLESQRHRYENATGDRGDWGKFLGAITVLGLAALGIYGLAKATERSEHSVKVECPRCRKVFPMALSGEPSAVVQIPCPHCQTDLVVNLGESAVSTENSNKPFAEWTSRCPSCGYEERVVFVSRPPYRGERIRIVCHKCQQSFFIGQPVYDMGIDNLEI